MLIGSVINTGISPVRELNFNKGIKSLIFIDVFLLISIYIPIPVYPARWPYSIASWTDFA